MMDVVFNNALENAEKSSNYLKKIKKQAKRLLKYSKENTQFTVNNLAQAQELLATINGYPNWHALEKAVSAETPVNIGQNHHVLSHVNKTSDSEAYVLIDKLDQYLIHRTPIELKSFFNINKISQNDSYNFTQYVKSIIAKLSFHFNMGFHNIEIKLMKSEGEDKIHIKNQYDLMSLSSSWNISPDFAKKLFNIESSLETVGTKKEYDLNIVIVVSTINEMESEHALFCSQVEEALSSKTISVKNAFSKKEYDFILNDSMDENMQEYDFSEQTSYIWNKLFYKEDGISSIFIYATQLMLKRSYDWNINIDCFHKKVKLFYEKNPTDQIKNKNYLDGIMKSLMKSYINEENNLYPMIEYEDKTLSQNIDFSCTDGIALTSLINGKINHYKNERYGKGIEAIYGKPGSGKSLFLNAKKCDILFRSDRNKLPFIGTIDIGNSSSGMMSLIRDSLPPDQKGLVQEYKLKMTKDYCINPFDTPLGCRFPNQYQQESLINFLQILINKDEYINLPQPATRNFINELISAMYNSFCDNGTPKKYDKGVVKEVDNMLNSLQVKTNNKTTWWEVVDILFLRSELRLAQLAQYHAVPLITELIYNIEKIKDMFRYETLSSNETLISYVTRMIMSVVEQYIVLANPTTLMIDDARIVSIDLDEVAKSGGKEANHQTTVMYLLAMEILNRKINRKPMYIYPVNVIAPSEVPVKEYMEYYSSFPYSRDENYLFYDEMHRVTTSMHFENYFKNQWNENGSDCFINVCSQTLNIFEQMKGLFSNIVLLSADYRVKEMSECFNLQKEEKELLDKRYVRGPLKNSGSVLFIKFMDRDKWKYNLLSFNTNQDLIDALSTKRNK